MENDMPVVQDQKGNLVELAERTTIIGPDGVQHPYNVVSVWSDADLAKIGVYRVARAEVPKGHRVKIGATPRYETNKKNGRPYQVLDTEKDPNVVVETKTTMTKKLAKAADVVPTIAEVRERASKEVDNRLGLDGPTLYMIQELKRREAERYLDDTAKKPDMDNYPFLSAAYVTKTEGKTVTEIAQNWVRQSAEAQSKLADLDALRVKTRKAIEAATTKADVGYVLDTFQK
jgi:hypothetical protein